MANKKKYCYDCQEHTRHISEDVNHVLHLLITLFLCGFWLPVWFVIAAVGKPFYCCKCGRRG